MRKQLLKGLRSTNPIIADLDVKQIHLDFLFCLENKMNQVKHNHLDGHFCIEITSIIFEDLRFRFKH